MLLSNRLFLRLLLDILVSRPSQHLQITACQVPGHCVQSSIRVHAAYHGDNDFQAKGSKASVLLAAGSSFKQDWDLAIPLSFLATAYSRTGRVVLAEGVLREASKLLKLSKDRTPAWSASAGASHASLPSRVAWQLAQLYSALPKRGAESHTWAEISQSLWPFTADWTEQNGSLDALSGSGSRGKTVAVSGWFGKAFPGIVAAK